MALPSHLLEAKKRMEAATKQEPEEVKAESAAPAEQQQPPVQEVVQEQSQSDEVFALDVSDDEQPAVAEQPQQQPVQQNAEIEALKKEVDQYKARWETLQGKYRKAEEARERLAQERSAVDGELNGLRAEVADLKKQLRQHTKKKLSEKIQESLSEEERAIHGDTIPVLSRMADQIQSSHEEEIEALRTELASQKQAQAEAVTQSQIRSFHEAFRARVPDAEKVAADPSWQAFTAKRDAISGKQISEIWEEQVRSMNVTGLVKIVEAWRKTNNASKAPVTPKTPTLSAAAPQPQFTEKSRYKYSDFRKASEAYRQNIRDQDAKKTYDSAKQRFEEAKARNLVDYAA